MSTVKLHEPPVEYVKPKGLWRNPVPAPLNPKARYRVQTWDMDKQEFTPQIGVRQGPYTMFGLRKALRKLRDMGYSIGRGSGVSIMVERYDPSTGLNDEMTEVAALLKEQETTP